MTSVQYVSALQVFTSALCSHQLMGAATGGPRASAGLLNALLHPPATAKYMQSLAAESDGKGSGLHVSVRAPCGESWIVFDGPLDGPNADELQPVLGGNTLWTGGGARVRLQYKQRIVWECANLQAASPALLNIVPLCHMRKTVINPAASLAAVADFILASCSLLPKVRVNAVCLLLSLRLAALCSLPRRISGCV